MMAAAASAIGVVLGQEIEISVPDTRVLETPRAQPRSMATLRTRPRPRSSSAASPAA